MVLSYISNSLYLVIHMFECMFSNFAFQPLLYIFSLIVIIYMFKKLVGLA